jgi:hypothetical protein
MKLSTYKNIYAYFINYSAGHHELNLCYRYATKNYEVNVLTKYSVSATYTTDCPYKAKQQFREWAEDL